MERELRAILDIADPLPGPVGGDNKMLIVAAVAVVIALIAVVLIVRSRRNKGESAKVAEAPSGSAPKHMAPGK